MYNKKENRSITAKENQVLSRLMHGESLWKSYFLLR